MRKVPEMVGPGRSVTTALCKMICVGRNKWCIEMTNGAAEVQLGCSLAGYGQAAPWKEFVVDINNFLLALGFLMN